MAQSSKARRSWMEGGGARGFGGWAAPSLEELLPQLSREEQQRLHDQLRKNTSRYDSMFSEQQRDSFMIHHVDDALRHYNARHPGGEFDAVKPLMEWRASFRDQVWFHINFWARCRSSNKIKRFFAEVHYKPSTARTISDRMPDLIPIVEICIIIEEPLCQYRRSCAFCPSGFDILHPKGCRKFVCGNDKDRIGQRLVPLRTGIPLLEMPFTSRPSSVPSPSSQEEEEKRGLFSTRSLMLSCLLTFTFLSVFMFWPCQ